MARQLQHRDERDTHRAANQQAAQICGPRIWRHRKHRCADARCGGADRQQHARAESISEQTRRDLHGHIAVEIKCRQIAQRRCGQPERLRQFHRNDGRCNALIETDEIKCRAQPPHGPRKRGRRVATFIRTQVTPRGSLAAAPAGTGTQVAQTKGR